MRWLMITRKLDPADDVAGFALRWVEALAARLDHLDVIAQEISPCPLPDNVSVYRMGKESGAGRLAQAWRLEQHLRHRVPANDGVFCHMIPRYVLFAAPWTRLYRKPLLLWYTHRAASGELRAAARLATHLLTASPRSFPLATPKLSVMGHGIETDLFVPSGPEDDPPGVVMVARLSRIKRQDWLLRAASQVMARGSVRPFRLVIIGGGVPNEPEYPAQLSALAGSLSPAPDVVWTGPLPRREVAQRVAASALAVNLSPPGLFDKAALETMLAGKPTLVSNDDFRPLLGDDAELLYLPEGASLDDLAARLERLLALSPSERAALGARLRARVLAAHSLDGLMDRIAALMREAVRHD